MRVRPHLAAGDCSYDQEWFSSRTDCFGKLCVGWFKRQVFPASIESQERSAPLADVIAYRPMKHRVSGFQRVEHRPHRNRVGHWYLYLSADARKRPQMWWKQHAYHGSV